MAYVPRYPPRILVASGLQRVRVANPIYGNAQWHEMGLAANWLRGKGSNIVCQGPMCYPLSTFYVAPNSSISFTHLISENSECTSYLLLVSLMFEQTQASSEISAFGNFTDPNNSGAVIGTWSLSPTDGQKCRNFRVVMQVAGASDELTLAITNNVASKSRIFCAGLVAVEMPRTDLSQDDGADERSVRSGEPIYDPGGGDVTKSLHGVASQIANESLTHSRLANICSFALPFPNAQFVNTTTTFETVQTLPIKMPRSLDGAATKTLTWRALVRATVGTGQIRVTSGGVVVGPTDTETVTIPSHASTPQEITGTIDVRTVDLNADGDVRDDDIEQIQVEIRRNTATTAAYLYGFWLYESIAAP